MVLIKRMEVVKGILSIAALKGQVKKVFDITSFGSCIPVFNTVADALAEAESRNIVKKDCQ